MAPNATEEDVKALNKAKGDVGLEDPKEGMIGAEAKGGEQILEHFKSEFGICDE